MWLKTETDNSWKWTIVFVDLSSFTPTRREGWVFLKGYHISIPHRGNLRGLKKICFHLIVKSSILKFLETVVQTPVSTQYLLPHTVNEPKTYTVRRCDGRTRKYYIEYLVYGLRLCHSFLILFIVKSSKLFIFLMTISRFLST